MSPPRPRTVSNLAKFSGSKETPTPPFREHPTITHPSSFFPPRPFLASPRLLSSANFILPRATTLSPPPPPPSLPPPHKTSRASQRARHPPVRCLYSMTRTPTRVRVCIYIYTHPFPYSIRTLLCHLPPPQHNHVAVCWKRRRYRRERPLVALHRANDTKGITLLVPFGIQKKRCLTRYPNIYPPSPSTFFLLAPLAPFPA